MKKTGPIILAHEFLRKSKVRYYEKNLIRLNKISTLMKRDFGYEPTFSYINAISCPVDRDGLAFCRHASDICFKGNIITKPRNHSWPGLAAHINRKKIVSANRGPRLAELKPGKFFWYQQPLIDLNWLTSISTPAICLHCCLNNKHGDLLLKLLKSVIANICKDNQLAKSRPFSELIVIVNGM